MFQMDVIPIDMELQKHWRNHHIVTDAMVDAFKKSLGFQPYHKIQDLTKERYKSITEKDLPPGRVAWLRIDDRPRVFGYRTHVIVTDLNGRNPTMLE